MGSGGRRRENAAKGDKKREGDGDMEGTRKWEEKDKEKTRPNRSGVAMGS